MTFLKFISDSKKFGLEKNTDRDNFLKQFLGATIKFMLFFY